MELEEIFILSKLFIIIHSRVNDGGLLTNNYKHNHIKSLRSYHKI